MWRGHGAVRPSRTPTSRNRARHGEHSQVRMYAACAGREPIKATARSRLHPMPMLTSPATLTPTGTGTRPSPSWHTSARRLLASWTVYTYMDEAVSSRQSGSSCITASFIDTLQEFSSRAVKAPDRRGFGLATLAGLISVFRSSATCFATSCICVPDTPSHARLHHTHHIPLPLQLSWTDRSALALHERLSLRIY